jgi:hypothetical protein
VATATRSSDVDEIRRQMAQIRRDLHQDVREVVASAEAVTDWHRYIRKYPWAAVGGAALLGYLVVPRRHRRVPPDLATQADVAQVRAAVEQTRETPKEPEPKRKGVVGMALAIIGPVALRAAQGYAVQYLENWIVQQQLQASVAGPPPPGPARAPGDPGRPRGTSGH